MNHTFDSLHTRMIMAMSKSKQTNKQTKQGKDAKNIQWRKDSLRIPYSEDRGPLFVTLQK